MRQAKDPPQLVIGHALAIADDDQCRRRLATAAYDLARALLDPIHHGERKRPQQICDSSFHAPTICAERTKNNLTNYVRYAHIWLRSTMTWRMTMNTRSAARQANASNIGPALK